MKEENWERIERAVKDSTKKVVERKMDEYHEAYIKGKLDGAKAVYDTVCRAIFE